MLLELELDEETLEDDELIEEELELTIDELLELTEDELLTTLDELLEDELTLEDDVFTPTIST